MTAVEEITRGPDYRPSIDMLETGDIDPDRFDHRAHVYVAWRYLRQFGLVDGMVRFSAALRRLTVLLGVEGKYHETITLFFMMAIADRLGTDRQEDWDSFCLRNNDLIGGGSLLSRHYSPAVLGSDEARMHFVLPDTPLT